MLWRPTSPSIRPRKIGSRRHLLDKRTRLERDIAVAEREIERIVGLLVKEIVSEEEAKEQLPPLRAARDQAKQELSELEPVDNVLVLHPASVKKYADQLKLLRENLGGNTADGHAGRFEPHTDIDRQGYRPARPREEGRRPGRDRGRPDGSACYQAPKLPALRRKKAVSVNDGSGGGIRTPDTRIMIPLL